MKAKWLPISAAVFMALSSASAFAADDNGWEFHGYGRLGGQWNGDGASKMNTLAKNEYRTVTSMDENSNQVEIQAKKHTVVKGKVYGDFVTRAEYGNQNAGDTGYFVSSEGSLQTHRNDAQFELKEAYIEMGGFDFLGSDTKIWAGQRYLNRQQGLLTKEFWKQSSGVGAGVQVGTGGFAVVSADQAGAIRSETVDQWGNVVNTNFGNTNANQTMTSFDAYYYGVQGGPLGGSFDFDLKYMKQANTDGDAVAKNKYGNRTSGAEDGIGGAITYNRNYYGFKGWSQTAIAYGQGMASNRGVNFGSWNGGFGKDTDALFLTSYGVAEVTKDLQLGSEITYWAPNHVSWGSDGDVDVSRLIVALQPSYKINDNLRAIFTGSYADEGIDAANGTVQWGRSEKHTQFYALEAALAFSVDSDYFGRPQIKPFVNWVNSGDAKAASAINIDPNKDGTYDQSEMFYGVEAEVWF